ncbi:hypothetical protein REPUB_Repub17cG0115100 [Reevesia pubescens]
MEKHKRSCRQGRKKVQLNTSNYNAGGGGMESVVVFGGALAIASLVAAFTFKKGSNNSRKDNSKDTTNLAAKEEDGTQGLRFILQDSSSTLHQNSCCTSHGTSKNGIIQIETSELDSTQSLITLEENTMQCERKDSVSGQQEIFILDAEQESVAMTGDYGDIEELSSPVSDHNKPVNVVENENDDSSVMKTIEIEIEDEAVDAAADSEPSMAEEMSTLQSTVSSTEEEKPSFLTGEEVEEYSLVQSSFSTEEEDEEEYSPMRSSFSTEEEYSPNRSSISTEDEDDEDEEEYSPMESSFSTEEEEEEEEYSPMESSFSTEEEEEEEEESPLQSSFSTEEEDENSENVTESSEETWSSSPESNMEAIWPAEMMRVLSPEPKEMIIRHRISVKKSEEKDKTAKIEAYNNLGNTFNESGSKKKKETQELVVMNDKREHSAKRQIWIWLSLVLLLLPLLVNFLLQQPNYLSNAVSLFFP